MAELENAEQDFMPVLRELEADGYLGFDADKLWFKSHLLRLWWARYHARGGEG
jgi:hypothetical protein